MINRKTVLILGAGASAPYGLPTGTQLLRSIDRALAGDGVQEAALLLEMDLDLRFEQLASLREALRLSTAPSIDSFLEHRPEYREIGKAVIAACLIPCEDPNRLYNPTNAEHAWYDYLFQRLDSSIDQFHCNQLTIITFNYDRSVEYFLLNAISNKYGLTEDRAVELLSTIPIVHVHGQLGKPAFLDSSDGDARQYSPILNGNQVQKCTRQIRIVHDSRDENDPEFDRARELLQSAQMVCFLGCAYHEANVRRLGFNEQLIAGGSIYGSAYKLERDEILRAKEFFYQMMFNPGTEDEDTRLFLRRYPVFR